jgi:hypothetical protein
MKIIDLKDILKEKLNKTLSGSDDKPTEVDDTTDDMETEEKNLDEGTSSEEEDSELSPKAQEAVAEILENDGELGEELSKVYINKYLDVKRKSVDDLKDRKIRSLARRAYLDHKNNSPSEDKE